MVFGLDRATMRPMVWVLMVMVPMAAAPGTAQAVTIDSNGTPFGGDAVARALGGGLDAIGRISIAAAGSVGTCSGTLIAPTVVLSAEHCFRGDDGSLRDAAAGFTTTVDFPTGPGAVTASVASVELFGAPTFGPTLLNGTDLAILTLTDPVTGIAPLGLFEGQLEVETVAIAGFGLNGDEDSGALFGVDGQRRAALNTLDAAVGVTDAEGNEGTILITDFDTLEPGTNRIGSARPVTDLSGAILEGAPAPGDSGGPLLVQRAGELLVAGVVSGGEILEGIVAGGGSLAFFTSVVDREANAFVTGFLDPVPLDAAAQAVPLPPSLLLLLGSLGVLFLRRGRAGGS